MLLYVSLVLSALDNVDESLRTGLDVGGIGFVRVDMHGESETWIDPDENIAKDQLTIALDPNAHG